MKKTVTTDDWAVLVMGFLMIPFSIVWRGYVLSVLWGWFIVPFGVMAIGVAHATGISIIISAFGVAFIKNVDSENAGDSPSTRVTTAVGKDILIPLFFLAFGWVVSSWM